MLSLLIYSCLFVYSCLLFAVCGWFRVVKSPHLQLFVEPHDRNQLLINLILPKTCLRLRGKHRDCFEKIPPLHPSANPVETFMRPLGKTMKIANYKGNSEQQALNSLLQNYRDTPHPSTGVPPASMMFRSSMSGTFPPRSISDENVEASRRFDKQQKAEKKRRRKQDQIERNFKRARK